MFQYTFLITNLRPPNIQIFLHLFCQLQTFESIWSNFVCRASVNFRDAHLADCESTKGPLASLSLKINLEFTAKSSPSRAFPTVLALFCEYIGGYSAGHISALARRPKYIAIYIGSTRRVSTLHCNALLNNIQ